MKTEKLLLEIDSLQKQLKQEEKNIDITKHTINRLNRTSFKWNRLFSLLCGWHVSSVIIFLLSPLLCVLMVLDILVVVPIQKRRLPIKIKRIEEVINEKEKEIKRIKDSIELCNKEIEIEASEVAEKFIDSPATVEITDRLTDLFVKAIKELGREETCKNDLEAKIVVTVGTTNTTGKGFRSWINSDTGERNWDSITCSWSNDVDFDYEARRYECLYKAEDRIALTSALRRTVEQKLRKIMEKDPSGTDYKITGTYHSIGVSLLYSAPNGNYKVARKW